MSTQERSGSRIPLSVKNIPTQEDPARDPALAPKQVLNAPAGHYVGSTNQHPRSRAALSRLPGFVSRSHFDLDLANQENAPIRTATTPKKRTIPLEHEQRRDGPAYSPSKRSRSSKTGTGSSTTEQSTGTTTALAQDLNGIRVAEILRPAPPPAPSRPPPKPAAYTTAAAASYAKVLRFDRHAHVDETIATQQNNVNERSAGRDASNEREIWRQKFKRAFPAFIFHFDSMDEASVKELTKIIQHLGGSVDQFFSRNVTHVVTTRPIPRVPEGLNKDENLDQKAPSQPGIQEGGIRERATSSQKKLFRPNFLTSRGTSSKALAETSQNRPVPLYSERNPFDERALSNDILVKAQEFGIKVWRQEKLKSVLSMLLDRPLRNPQGHQKQDLSQMLEKEKIFGTLERDPNAARNDFHYFDRSSYYILVEDATLEHRPIMCQEHKREDLAKKRAEGHRPPWPVLRVRAEGRCPFLKPNEKDESVEDSPQPEDRFNNHRSMRRAVSLNNMARANLGPAFAHLRSLRPPEAPGRQEYPMASGNSVAITSNIASTTSTAFTDHQPGKSIGLPQNRRVAELNRRMHTPYAAQPARPLDASPASVLPGSAGSGLGIQREGGSPIPGMPLQQHTGQVPEQGATIRRMLGLAQQAPAAAAEPELQSVMRRTVSTGTVPKSESAKKPGYCENCRIKYADFSEHISDRKHRKFAHNDANFVDIDSLILRVQRPALLRYDDEEMDRDSSGFFFEDEVPSSQPEELAFADDEGSVSADSFAGAYSPKQAAQGQDFDNEQEREPGQPFTMFAGTDLVT